MLSNLSMLTLSEKALLVKLYYQNRKSATAALRSCRHRKYIRTGKGSHTSSAVKRMISMFEDTDYSDNRSRSGRPNTSATAAWTVGEEMETVEGFIYARQRS